MTTLQAAPTRHSHTELISGILSNKYLPSPKIKGEGGREGWEKHSTKMASKQQDQSKDTLQRTASKQLCM